MREKLDLLKFDPEEERKALIKFSPSLALISLEELRDALEFLSIHGINITKARELKVFTNTIKDMADKISMAQTIHEPDIFKEDPLRLNCNMIDVNRRIQYCKQAKIPYKTEEGKYKSFLFREIAFLREAEPVMTSSLVEPIIEEAEEEIVTLAPETSSESKVIDITPFLTSLNEELEETESPVVEEASLDDSKFIDIRDYRDATEDLRELEAKTTDFATIREELNSQLAELSAIKEETQMDYDGDVISFTDLEPENYEMRRVA